MTEVLQKEKLAKVYEKVAEISHYEKNDTLSAEEIINNFLDKILQFKKNLIERTVGVNKVVALIEELTWTTIENKDVLDDIKRLIDALDKGHSKLIKLYVSFNPIRKGIAKSEITGFKQSLDNLLEVKEDIISVFFTLPNDKEFQEVTKGLSNL